MVLDYAGVLLSVPSLLSVLVEGRDAEERIKSYHDELMMFFMSMLLDYSSDGCHAVVGVA